MKKLIVFAIFVVAVLVLLVVEWDQPLLQDGALFLANLQEGVSYGLLWVTIPLFVLQGVVTFFPIATLLVVHLTVFGFWEGVFFSSVGAFLGSMVCFYLGRYFFHDYFQKMWQRNYTRYEKWIKLAENHGMWGLVFIRHIPILPSCIVSLVGAFSPINNKAYLWSSVFGNLSMVWLYTLVLAGIAVPVWLSPYLWGYVAFILALLAFFIIHVKRLSAKWKQDETNTKSLSS